MQYTQIGRSGLKVSRLCLGSMNFGPHTTQEDSFRIMDRALDLGINFFDTANVYGQGGATEKIIGNWFTKGKDHRGKVVLATKVYGGSSRWPNKNRLSAKHIREACDDSLKNLQTDYIDIYQMHHIDRNTPWEEIWQAMEVLVTQGKILYVGSSNFAGWHIAHANGVAKNRNFMGLVSEQSLYNLTARSIELEVIPACREFGLGLIPWSPLASGLLAGDISIVGNVRRAESSVQKKAERYRKQLGKYQSLCQNLGETSANVALAWLLHNPVVTAPIIGPRTLDQLDSSIDSAELTLPDEILQKIDEIWPGPGGEAPEAYAW
jgi:aryl-alcohol dehydrogenase-like predicted oxidoreductase